MTATEQQQQSSIADQILKMLYAPHKAFKEIMQSPKYMGPILILILFIAANIAFGYSLISKTYVEQTLPSGAQLDEWTENATKWTSSSGAYIAENFNDFMNGSYYGNRSIEFSMSNSSRITMELLNIGPINCLGSDGFKNVSVRIKLVSPLAEPESASIYMFSRSISNYLVHNLTDTLSNSTNTVWNNVTIPLANANWVNYNADWGNVTGLRLDLSWPQNSSINVLVDGLFFRGNFKSPAETEAFSYLMNFSIVGLMQFAFEWLFLGGIIYILARTLGGKTTWRPVLISIGFVLIVLFVQTVINAIAISTLPNLYYPLELLGGVQGETAAAAAKITDITWLVSAITSYLRIVIYIWTVVLCTLATRVLNATSWAKSALISVVAFFATITLMSLLLGI